MDYSKIPDHFVNKEVLVGLLKEAREYRRRYRIATVFAVTGWAVVIFTLLVG